MKGFEESYEVSDSGQVRSLTRLVQYSNGKKRTHLGRVLKTSSKTARYPLVTLYKNGISTSRTVHSLVLEAFRGDRPEGFVALHLNNDPTDNRLENLQWGTQAENIQQSVRDGTHVEARKTECPKGHPLLKPNLIPSSIKKGHRICLTCARVKDLERHREITLSVEEVEAVFQEVLSSKGASQSRKLRKSCPRGHPLKPPNLVESDEERGFRNCLACGRVRGSGVLVSDPSFKSLSDARLKEILKEEEEE